MYRKYLFILLPVLLFATSAAADDIAARLLRADAYRQAAESLRVEMVVELYKGEALDNSRRYRVYIKPGRRSLVVFKSAAESGQKVLMRGDDFHMFLPRSRRAIRITPMQKLLGEASTGDVASMSWHEEYDARLLEDKADHEGTVCRLLELKSHRPGTTYERIELYLDRRNDAPVYARLYLKSGKLAKEARYHMGELNGRPAVVRLTLLDRIRRDQRTEIRYLSMQAQAIPDRYFNPQYLLRAQVD
jgi:hypothetical protein